MKHNKIYVLVILTLMRRIYLDKGTPGVEQNNPTELPGTKNFDFSVATAISHIETN